MKIAFTALVSFMLFTGAFASQVSGLTSDMGLSESVVTELLQENVALPMYSEFEEYSCGGELKDLEIAVLENGNLVISGLVSIGRNYCAWEFWNSFTLEISYDQNRGWQAVDVSIDGLDYGNEW